MILRLDHIYHLKLPNSNYSDGTASIKLLEQSIVSKADSTINKIRTWDKTRLSINWPLCNLDLLSIAKLRGTRVVDSGERWQATSVLAARSVLRHEPVGMASGPPHQVPPGQYPAPQWQTDRQTDWCAIRAGDTGHINLFFPACLPLQCWSSEEFIIGKKLFDKKE